MPVLVVAFKLPHLWLCLTFPQPGELPGDTGFLDGFHQSGPGAGGMLGKPFIKKARTAEVMFRVRQLLIEANQVHEVTLPAREKLDGCAAPDEQAPRCVTMLNSDHGFNPPWLRQRGS